jgi:thiol-disulfide isomerase/thioredoxin
MVNSLATAVGLTLGLAPFRASASGQIVWPDLSLATGGKIAAQEWADTAAIVVFWETWCPYCKRHNALIHQLFHENSDRRIRILGVAMDGSRAQVQNYLRSNGLDFPVAMGTTSFRSQFTERSVVPMTCLVGFKGQLLQTIPGEMAEKDVMSLPSIFSRG